MIKVKNVRRKKLSIFGDCADCRHSIIYHIMPFGCMKCSCDEYH